MKTPPLTPALAERWKQGLPVTLPQLAAVNGLTYEQVRKLAAMQGFPKVAGKIWPEDFVLWRRGVVGGAVGGMEGSVKGLKQSYPPIPQDRGVARAGKCDARRSRRDSQGAWPSRAAHLRELTA